MSRAEREAFEHGAMYFNSAYGMDSHEYLQAVRLEGLSHYPDKLCENVREIVVEWLKENGYGGLFNNDDGVSCSCKDEIMNCYACFDNCRPGVLRDGKIVPKEEA